MARPYILGLLVFTQRLGYGLSTVMVPEACEDAKQEGALLQQAGYYLLQQQATKQTSKQASKRYSEKRGSGSSMISRVAGKFAIVRPFWEGDLWSLLKHTPEDTDCSSPGTSLIDLILLYSGTQADFQHVWEKEKVGVDPETWAARYSLSEGGKGCYLTTRFEVLSEDSGGYPRAACTSFKHMFQTDPPVWGYDAVYQMEPDVMPIRQQWLDEVLPLLQKAGSGQAWAIGARYTPECMVLESEPTELSHTWTDPTWLNGNAVYSSNASMVRNALSAHCPSFDVDFVPSLNPQYLFSDKLIDCNPGSVKEEFATIPWSELLAKYVDSPIVMVHVKNSKTYREDAKDQQK